MRAGAAVDRLPRHARVDDVPFDERRGLIRNVGGRVCDEDSRSHRGEYVVGWIKRGPSGVIGTNKKDAADTVAKIVQDAGAGALREPAGFERDWSSSASRPPSSGEAGARSTSASAAPASRRAGRA